MHSRYFVLGEQALAELRRLAQRRFVGVGAIRVTETRNQVVISFRKDNWPELIGSGARSAAGAQFAMVVAKVGTEPPYRYTAAEASIDESGNWALISGGTVFENVFNIEEQGEGRSWMSPLRVGDAVVLYSVPGQSDVFVCARYY